MTYKLLFFLKVNLEDIDVFTQTVTTIYKQKTYGMSLTDVNVETAADETISGPSPLRYLLLRFLQLSKLNL